MAALLLVICAASPAIVTAKSAPVRQTYRLCHYDTVQTASEFLDVPEKDLLRWNKALIRGNKFRKGVTRIIFYSSKKLTSESVGRPSSGRLVGGVSLDCDGDDKGFGWIISSQRTNIYGTPETIRNIRKAALDYRNYFKGRGMPYVPLAIGTLSQRHGGELPPHASHQSGRDVDVGVILTDGNKPGTFATADRLNMDDLRTWVMLKSFLDTGDVQYIFMHRALVDEIKTYVKKIYRSNNKLLRKYLQMFKEDGVIEGDAYHSSHIHIRFKCPRGDRKCVP